MSWSAKLMGSLDQRSAVLRTERGTVQLAREGEGPPVLVLHGGPGGFDQALAWSRHLHTGGCEVIAVSRPGYLRTPLQSGPTPADQADLCSAVLDVLEIGRVAALGFSSGGAAAVHFAARHPHRAVALLLDAAILLPYRPPISALQQAAFESAFLIWLSYQATTRAPRLALPLMIEGLATGLSKQQKKAAANWITADPARLQSLQEQAASVAPRRYRQPGWVNDRRNESDLVALPFGDVAVPTLIAHGANDAVVTLEHATNAIDKISGAELIVVDQGHHLLSLSRRYGPVADRQLQLAHSS